MSTALCTPRGAEACHPHSHGLAFGCTCPRAGQWPETVAVLVSRPMGPSAAPGSSVLTALLGPHVPSAATALLGGLQLRGETQGSVRAPGFRGGACCRLPYSPHLDAGGAPGGPRDGSCRTQWLRGGLLALPLRLHLPPPHAVRVSGPRLLESETGILPCPRSLGSLTVRICQPCRAPSLSPSLCTGCACVSSGARLHTCDHLSWKCFY